MMSLQTMMLIQIVIRPSCVNILQEPCKIPSRLLYLDFHWVHLKMPFTVIPIENRPVHNRFPLISKCHGCSTRSFLLLRCAEEMRLDVFVAGK